MTTNDVRPLDQPGAGPVYTVLLTAKGKYLHDMFAYSAPGEQQHAHHSPGSWQQDSAAQCLFGHKGCVSARVEALQRLTRTCLPAWEGTLQHSTVPAGQLGMSQPGTRSGLQAVTIACQTLRLCRRWTAAAA